MLLPHRFIAFDVETGMSLAHAGDVQAAIREAGGPADRLEVVDCGTLGRSVWLGVGRFSAPLSLHRARKVGSVVHSVRVH